jgi:hypothetical protein
MPNIQSFYKALKMSWLHKLLDPFNHSPWKALLLGSMQKWGVMSYFNLMRCLIRNVTLNVLKY